jgi:hypothetical protein
MTLCRCTFVNPAGPQEQAQLYSEEGETDFVNVLLHTERGSYVVGQHYAVMVLPLDPALPVESLRASSLLLEHVVTAAIVTAQAAEHPVPDPAQPVQDPTQIQQPPAQGAQWAPEVAQTPVPPGTPSVTFPETPQPPAADPPPPT